MTTTAEARVKQIVTDKPTSGVEALAAIQPDSTTILFATESTAIVAVYPDFSALIAYYEEEGQVLSLAHSEDNTLEAWEKFLSYLDDVFPEMASVLRDLFDSKAGTLH